VVEEDLE
jgi:hypothetical protein